MAKPTCERCGQRPVAFHGMKVCGDCENVLEAQDSTPTFVLEKELLAKAKAVRCFTTPLPASEVIEQELGLVFGTSSKQAFWGLSTQADRLARAYEAALSNLCYDAASKGANAVVGITFALNNSTGSNVAIAGSSEAVMLLGTAVKI